MTLRRDEELGAALRALEVPEHGPEFFEQLWQRLAAADPDVVQPRPDRHRSHRPLRLAAVTAVAVAAAIIIGVILPGRLPLGSRPASAAEVVQKASQALATVRTVSGRAHIHEVARGAVFDQTFQFTLSADGDLRVDDPSAGTERSYEAAKDTLRSLTHDPGGAIAVFEQTGVPPGPPDGMPGEPFVGRDLAAVVRDLRAAPDTSVREAAYQGRPAWHLHANLTPNLIGPAPLEIDVVVDKATGLPVDIVESGPASGTRQVQLTDLTVDGLVPPGSLVVAIPPGADVTRVAGPFRTVSLDQVATTVGYRPAVPASLPPGFHLTGVAVAAMTQPTGAEGSNPPGRHVVSLTYRRGLESVVVTTRLVGPDPFAWSDPIRSEGQVLRSQPVTLARGALAGARAEVVVDPVTTPHLWALGTDLVLTIAGDASRDEMIHIAESLQR